MDDGTSYLIELKDLKLLRNDDDALIKTDEKPDQIEEDTVFLEQLSNEISEERHALARISGYVLLKTIKNESCKCQNCIEYFTAHHEVEQPVNALIDQIEFKKGALTRPSEIGNEIFQQAELVFRLNRKKLCSKPRMGDSMTNLILQNLKTKFGNLPSCHLELIFKRFVKIRFHFWINFQNSIDQRQQKYRIIGESNSSRSMFAKLA